MKSKIQCPLSISRTCLAQEFGLVSTCDTDNICSISTPPPSQHRCTREPQSPQLPQDSPGQRVLATQADFEMEIANIGYEMAGKLSIMTWTPDTGLKQEQSLSWT